MAVSHLAGVGTLTWLARRATDVLTAESALQTPQSDLSYFVSLFFLVLLGWGWNSGLLVL